MARTVLRWLTAAALVVGGGLARPGLAAAQHGHHGGYHGFSFYHGYGHYPYYGYWGGYYPFYGYGYSSVGSVRVQVEPEQARVYVDGYYAGIVDDFDGLFQRLHVSPGRHEITLKLEGYKTHRMKSYVPPDHTIKIHYSMVKGTGEDDVEDMVGPIGGDEDRRYSRDDPGYGDDPGRRPRAHREDAIDPGRRDRGELRLNVRPGDASVYVDGEFRGSGGQVGGLRLSPGHHRIEVVRPGFRTFEREVEIRGDEPVELDVDLESS